MFWKCLDFFANTKVQFSTTCDWYFTILVKVSANQILAENTFFTNHIGWTEDEFIRQCHDYSIITQWLFNKHKIIQQNNQIIWQCDNFKNILIDHFALSQI